MLTRINEKYILSLPSIVDAASLSEFFSHLESVSTANVSEIFLDFSPVEDISERYVAILCQALGKLREAGIAVHIESFPDELREILKRYNMLNLFEQVQDIGIRAKIPGKDQVNDDRRMIELSFPPSAGDISRAVDVFKTFLIDNKIIELETFELITVFYEVATNIRLHACLADDARVDFSALLYGKEILIRFEDAGKTFDPGTALHGYNRDRAAKSGKKRGLGLILVNRLIDSISYIRSDNGKNILCLKKFLTNGGGDNDTSSSCK